MLLPLDGMLVYLMFSSFLIPSIFHISGTISQGISKAPDVSELKLAAENIGSISAKMDVEDRKSVV